ncbi:ribonuclease H-like domain-containing protein [Tanacetum coccineum]
MHQHPKTFPGFRDPRHPDHVCLLNTRPLMGLNRAPRAWFSEIFGLCCSGWVFIIVAVTLHSSSYKGGIQLLLALYVDDIVLTASSSDLLQQIITSLHAEFSMTDLGSLNYFLGISLAGALQYLTFTRPDISYAVQQVCLFMHDPREPHLSALKRVLRYVSGTLSYGLQLYSSTTSDADWAGCPTTRRSTSGYCVFLGNNLLSWSSKRQFTLSRI